MAFLKGLCARYPVNKTQKIYAQYISVWYLERKHRKLLQKLQEKRQHSGNFYQHVDVVVFLNSKLVWRSGKLVVFFSSDT